MTPEAAQVCKDANQACDTCVEWSMQQRIHIGQEIEEVLHIYVFKVIVMKI